MYDALQQDLVLAVPKYLIMPLNVSKVTEVTLKWTHQVIPTLN
jgi:hypothetical protein